jgi:hypothetical protein
MRSYEELVAMDGSVATKNLCFPCPHCRRRYVGRLSSLASHLFTDHRNVTEDHSAVEVMLMDDDRVKQCDFCSVTFSDLQSLNKHLISCTKNTSGHSASIGCMICGKLFAQER